VIILWKGYKIEIWLQWKSHRKSYVAYRMAPLLMTLKVTFAVWNLSNSYTIYVVTVNNVWSFVCVQLLTVGCPKYTEDLLKVHSNDYAQKLEQRNKVSHILSTNVCLEFGKYCLIRALSVHYSTVKTLWYRCDILPTWTAFLEVDVEIFWRLSVSQQH